MAAMVEMFRGIESLAATGMGLLSLTQDNFSSLFGALVVAQFVSVGLLACFVVRRAWKGRGQHLQVVQNQEMPGRAYDVVLKVISIRTFVETRRLAVTMSAGSVLDMAQQERYRIVALAGLFDKGKTFLVNALFGCNLPSGKLHTTEGLSMIWCSELRILVVDSAGCQAPVSFLDQDVDLVLNAQITESFLFELLSRMAHHLLFVVSDFTWFEQKYVKMLQQKYALSKRSNELVVVHNLKDTSEVEEADLLFQSQLKARYEGIEHNNKLCFVSQSNPCVHHVGFCKVPSKAAAKYNGANLSYLHSRFNSTEVLGTLGALGAMLASHCQEILPKFVLVEPTITQSLHVRFDPCASNHYENYQPGNLTEHTPYHSAGAITLELDEGYSVQMKKRGVTSPLGEVVLHDVTFDPKVNVFDEHGGRRRRFVRVECPGVKESDIEILGLPNGVALKIDQKKSINELCVEPVEPIFQTHGIWQRKFEFDPAGGMFVLLEDEMKLELGVLHLTFDRMESRKVALPGRKLASFVDTASPGSSDADSVVFVPQDVAF